MSRRHLLFAASLLVSGVFLWLALRDVPLDAVVDSIRGADLAWVALSLAFVVGAQFTRAMRWRGLLGGRMSPMRSFHILNITMLLNQLPLRAGEVARSLLATRSGVPLVTAATSIVIERLIDMLLVVIVLAIAVSRLPTAPPSAGPAAAAFGVVSIGGFIALILLARHPERAHQLLGGLERRAALLARLRLRQRLEEVLDGLRPLTDLRQLAPAIGWTLAGWFFSLATLYALERALAIEGVDLVLGATLGVMLVVFSIAIPVSVAAIGPFESAVRVAGDAVGMSTIASTSLGFIFHGATVLSYAFWGVIGLLVLGVSLGDVMKSSEQPPEPAADL